MTFIVKAPLEPQGAASHSSAAEFDVVSFPIYFVFD